MMNYKLSVDDFLRLSTALSQIFEHLSFAIPRPYIEFAQNFTDKRKSAFSGSISHSFSIFIASSEGLFFSHSTDFKNFTTNFLRWEWFFIAYQNFQIKVSSRYSISWKSGYVRIFKSYPISSALGFKPFAIVSSS